MLYKHKVGVLFFVPNIKEEGENGICFKHMKEDYPLFSPSYLASGYMVEYFKKCLNKGLNYGVLLFFPKQMVLFFITLKYSEKQILMFLLGNQSTWKVRERNGH